MTQTEPSQTHLLRDTGNFQFSFFSIIKIIYKITKIWSLYYVSASEDESKSARGLKPKLSIFVVDSTAYAVERDIWAFARC